MALNPKEHNAMATVIGESILISGNLEGDEDLTIRGRVEGSVRLQRTLIVEASGIVKADVTVKDAIISGVVVGNVNASDSVQITAEGRMVGDVAAPRVIIVDGASFRGRIDMGEVDTARPQGERATGKGAPAKLPARAPAPPARAPAKEPARPAPAAARPPSPPSAPPLPPSLAGAKRKVLLKKGKR
jgi:cytoskeletal protein CcmA (bactofilin family)